MLYYGRCLPNIGTEGGRYMMGIIEFLYSVIAGMIANILCKWLDRH